MKFHDTHFETQNESTLHPTLKTLYATFPSNMHQLRNLIFYGPSGTGKYTQALACIRRYSPTRIKYEKRLTVTYNKETYLIKMSDIHFEIDMSLLGCTSKLLWNEMHSQIVDVISARADPVGIIVCKYFHKIHSELLETFYSYMHMPHHGGPNHIRLKYILISEHIGFIPTHVLNSCQIIPVARPTAAMYKKVLSLAPGAKVIPENVTNIKLLQNPIPEHEHDHSDKHGDKHDDAYTTPPNAHLALFNNACTYISNIDQIRFTQLRELLYDILIYDFDITDFAWHLITELKRKELLHDDNMSDVLIHTYKFLQYYNNNYRPIYHLENFVFMLINMIGTNRTQAAPCISQMI